MKLGICASGGGHAGIRHLAYLEVLERYGIRPFSYYGTSTGALAVSTKSWIGIDGLRDMWSRIKSENDVFEQNWYVRVPWESGVKNAGPLRKLVQAAFDARRPGHPRFKVCSVNLCKRFPEGSVYFADNHPEIVDMVTASARFPILVEGYDPRPGEFWVDGGLTDNIPIRGAIADGCDVIIALHCFPLDRSLGDMWTPGNPLVQLRRILDLYGEQDYEEDMQASSAKLINIAPERATVGCFDFSDLSARQRAYEESLQDAERAIPSVVAALRSRTF